MRLLIAKLASAAAQSVSVAMNSEHDIADVATDIESCLRLLRGSDYDLAVVIMGHGRMRARDAIARMRRDAGKVPMVVLTELGETDPAPLHDAYASDARIAADHSGIDRDATDLFGGDADGGSWQARVGPSGAPRALSATAVPATQAVSLSLEADTETVRLSGHPLPLSQAEYRIFAALWQRRGDIIPAHDLLAAVYGDAARPASRVLPVFLFKLRRKLRSAGLGDLIETAVGRGFTIRQWPPLAIT